MTTLSRRLARARVLPGGAVERVVLAIDVLPGAPRYVVRGWDGAPAGLADAAAALRARLAPGLAPRDRAALEAEVGVVEFDGPGGAERQAYALALAADAPLLLDAGPGGVAPTPASRAYDGAAPPAGLPVVLRPSAVLSLVTAWLEAAPRDEVAAALAQVVHIAVTGASPYPPDHFPLDDPALALLARLEHWRFAFDGISDVRRRNLRLEPAAAPSPLPACYAAIDALTARSAAHGGATPWRATWSVRAAADVQAAAEPLLLALDPAALLRGARPVGAAEPACDRDPIQGDLWGWAPPLALAGSGGDLLEQRA